MWLTAGVMDSFQESDWLSERQLPLGPVSVRVWPSRESDVTQSQWSAVDVWIGMRSRTLDVPAVEKGRARYFDDCLD